VTHYLYSLSGTHFLIVDNYADTQGDILFTVIIYITMDNLTLTVLAIIILILISNSKPKKKPEKKKEGSWKDDKKGDGKKGKH
jgi:hypothetical protein